MTAKMLEEFYARLLMWVKDGCPHDNYARFIKTEGLCFNLTRYMKTVHGADIQKILYLKQKMRKNFKWAGFDPTLPFNRDYGQYLTEVREKSIFINPARMQWLEQHADPELMKGYKPEPRKEHVNLFSM